MKRSISDIIGFGLNDGELTGYSRSDGVLEFRVLLWNHKELIVTLHDPECLVDFSLGELCDIIVSDEVDGDVLKMAARRGYFNESGEVRVRLAMLDVDDHVALEAIGSRVTLQVEDRVTHLPEAPSPQS